jgi:methylmalonyl-CoA mutase N-terminal domain/subunit
MERYHEQVKTRELPKVGLNVHRIPEADDTLLKDIVEGKIEPCWGRIDQIRAYKNERDPKPVGAALHNLYQTAKDDSANLMAPILHAMAAEATTGEMAGVIRQAYDVAYDPHGFLESPV